ncbi:MAG TPA: SusC/RagA family TonB-linked outer membrane protein [Gemmatimonadaceae bacterium]|nr:SusC/RagA family TonB-linked outer membrane protein [Gemmatimonadaceae bacterium]
MSMVRCLTRAAALSLLFVSQLGAQGSTGTITGRVVDSASRQPLSAVSLRLVGTQRGAMTREDGSFTLPGVPAGAQRVRASRIGFGPQVRDVNVPAGGSASVEFVLPAQAAVLGEMVVTGYGAQRRESITGSVATVEADQANVGVITNANQMLQGRVAGLQMVTNNGEPGGGAQIRIRGGTSISASNDPLYVVDGIPLQNESTVAGAYGLEFNAALPRSPLNTINPNDIESITVLKDASATAIYGSRGANGVILIQTRRGLSGRPSIDYDVYVAAASPSHKLDFLTGDQYRTFVQQQVTAGKLPAGQLAGLGTANTDWEDALTRTGYTTSHNLSFAGGAGATTYRASLNYFDQKGVVIANGLKRYQGRLNAQHQAFDGKLGLGLTLTASRVNNNYLAMENGGGFSGGVFTNMAIFNPTQPVTLPTGAYYEIGAGAQGTRNPVALAEQITDVAPENRVLGNLSASLELIPSLTAQTTLGVDYTDAVRDTYFPIISPIGAQYGGAARQAQRSLQNLNFQQLLTFTPKLSRNQELDVVGGYEYSTFKNNGFEVISQGFVTDVFQFNNLGAGTPANSPAPVSYIQESKLVSFFSRANYGYAEKYFLTGVIRRDGSSRLAEGNKWSTFPAVSASWRLSNEDFMKGRTPFSSLALRAGWGRQGNQAIQPYATQLLLKTDNGSKYPFGGTVLTGLAAVQVANPDLKWETSEQTNVGLDWGVKSDRFTGIFDLYSKKTKDLLLRVPVPQPAVVSSRIENIGTVQNRGFEATVEGRLWDTQSKSLSSGLLLSVERSEVKDIGADRQFLITGGVFGQGQSGRFAQRLIPGQPLGTFWGPHFLRVETSGANAGKQVFSCVASSAGCVNNETFAPTGADEGIIGNANPSFSMGFHSNLTWNKFDASWNWRGEFGRDVFNNTALVYSTKGNAKQGRNFLATALDDPTGIDEPSIYSSRWIEDGSFVRLQNVTLGYTFTLPQLSGRPTRVYVSGDNLLLFTGYSGYDPEVFTDANQDGIGTRGIDYLTYPRARTITTGVRLSF